MDNLNLIFLGIGFVILFICLVLLIVKLVKGNGKPPLGLISSMITGFLFILIGFGLMVPNLKEKIIGIVSKEEVPTLAEKSISGGESAIGGNTAVSNETEPQKIARELVEKEMSKQVGLKSWEITENKVTSDKTVLNIADYDKPAGDMRIVWIEGNVKATAADDGSTGNVGYTLELYQMKGETKWYIGNHWGVLIDLVVTEKPVVKEDKKYLSDSEELPIPKESSQLEKKSINVAKPEQTVFTENDLTGAWYWNDSDDFYMLLRKDYTYSYIEKNSGFVSEGNYTVKKVDDHFEVTVHYTTGEYDSVMTIKLNDKNHLEGSEDGNSWKAEKIKLAEAEGILNSIKGK